MKRNIFFFYCYRISSRLYFHLPVLFIFFFTLGMGVIYTEILLMVYGLTIMLASGLSQQLTVFLKQKQVIAIGEFCKGLGILLIVLGTQVATTNFWLPLSGQIVGGIGFSLSISNDSSLLKTIVLSSADNSLFGQIQSKTQSLMFLATLVAGAIGGVLFDYEAHWPFYGSMMANLVAIFTILMISEIKVQKKDPDSQQKLASKHRLNLQPEQEFWLNYYAVSRAFLLAPFVGFFPFFFLMLQVDFYLFGVVLGLFSIAAFLSALYSVTILTKLGFSGTMILTASCILASMSILAIYDYFWTSLIALTLLGFGSGCVRPLTMKNLDFTGMTAQERVQTLSLMERRFSLLNAVLLVLGGFIIVEQGFQILMRQIGITYLFLFLLLMYLRTLEKSNAN
jgi:hypothetical protein